MTNFLPKIMGWLVIIITLALAPSINTANATIVSANLTNLIGMTAVSAFGAPIMIISLLVAGGMFGLAGVQGKLASAGVKDMMEVIGAVIVTIVALTMFDAAIDYINTLIGASSGFAITIYGVIAIVLYIGIIAGAGALSIVKYRKIRRGGGGKKYKGKNY